MTPEFMTLALRFLLALTGAGVLVIGANVGLGGIRTMGLQVDPGFVAEVDAEAFFDQDNHVRYLGGVFAAVGAALIAGAIAFRALRPGLVLLLAVAACGALFRFSQAGFDILARGSLLPSLAFELLIFPALAIWVARTKT